MKEKTTKENNKRKVEEEYLAKEKAKQDKKERKEAERMAKFNAKQRDKLEKKLGVQKPGKYIIELESRDTDLIRRLEMQMEDISDLYIDAFGGSWEGARYGIHLDKSIPILLKLSDLPEVSRVKLDHNTIQLSVNK